MIDLIAPLAFFTFVAAGLTVAFLASKDRWIFDGRERMPREMRGLSIDEVAACYNKAQLAAAVDTYVYRGGESTAPPRLKRALELRTVTDALDVEPIVPPPPS